MRSARLVPPTGYDGQGPRTRISLAVYLKPAVDTTTTDRTLSPEYYWGNYDSSIVEFRVTIKLALFTPYGVLLKNIALFSTYRCDKKRPFPLSLPSQKN